jgi:hypothetical protein
MGGPAYRPQGILCQVQFWKVVSRCVLPISVFPFLAAYLENAVLHRHVDGNESSFFTAALEMYGIPCFRPARAGPV